VKSSHAIFGFCLTEIFFSKSLQNRPPGGPRCSPMKNLRCEISPQDKSSVLLSRPFFRSRDQDLIGIIDKMNLNALESREHGLEITTLQVMGSKFQNANKKKRRYEEENAITGRLVVQKRFFGGAARRLEGNTGIGGSDHSRPVRAPHTPRRSVRPGGVRRKEQVSAVDDAAARATRTEVDVRQRRVTVFAVTH